MSVRMVRLVGPREVPFAFHIDGLRKVGPGVFPGSHEQGILLNYIVDVCDIFVNHIGYEIFVVALPDKGDPLEAASLDMIGGLEKELCDRGVPYRAMKRNTDLPEIDITDALVFNLIKPE